MNLIGILALACVVSAVLSIIVYVVLLGGMDSHGELAEWLLFLLFHIFLGGTIATGFSVLVMALLSAFDA